MRIVGSKYALPLSLAALAMAPALGGCDCGGGTGADDAGSTDAFRVRFDAPVEDGGPDAGRTARDPERCRIEPTDTYLLGTDSDVAASVRVLGVAGAASEFGVVWREAIDGFAQVRLARIPSTTGAPVSQTITEGTVVHEDPAIATIADGYLVGWVDNSTDDFEVYARSVAAATMGPVERLTSRMGRDDSPSLVAVGDNVIAAWAESRDTDTRRVAVTRLLAASGTPMGTAQDVSTAANITRPVLAPREGGAVVLYTESSASLPDVRLQRLDPSGVPMGTSEVMSTEHNASGDVDVGLTARDGAAVFGAVVAGVRRDVRVRLLDGSGTPGMSEFALNLGTELGDSASVARLREANGWSEGCRDGYAVVYRSYPDGGTSAVLRLVLLDAGAALVRAVDLSPPDISDRGGRVTVRIAGDGQLLVAWTDTRPARVDMRAARIRCD